MFKRKMLIISVSLLFGSCFMYDEYYMLQNVPATQPVLNEDQKADSSVRAYMSDRFRDSPYQYKALESGRSFTVKHPEESELKQLKMNRQLLMENGLPKEKLDSMLIVQDSLIAEKEKKVTWLRDSGSVYKMRHVFVLKENEDKYKICEGTFELDKNFRVTDVHLLMKLNISEYQYACFLDFLHQRPLFCDQYYSDNEDNSKALYRTYNLRLESGQVDRSEFMKTILAIVADVKATCTYNETGIVKEVVKQYAGYEKMTWPGYSPVGFSTPQELIYTTEGKDSLAGYSVFHSFTAKDVNTGEVSTNCFYFELDSYFMVMGSLKVEPPFDKYFKKD